MQGIRFAMPVRGTSSEINERDESIFDFIISGNVLAWNSGSILTFQFPSSGNSSGTYYHTNKQFDFPSLGSVYDQRSFSDYSLLLFNLNLAAEVSYIS